VAVALFAACHNRSEDDEVGAAPDRGDTSAVAVDTSQSAPTEPPMVQVPADTAMYDTTGTAMPNDTSLTGH
jgi:hypothetical protein